MITIIAILAILLILCVGVIYAQDKTIERQRRRLIEALDWIDPAELVREDWLG